MRSVNAMLLNEFLKEHRKVEEQAGEIMQMKKQIEALTAVHGKNRWIAKTDRWISPRFNR